MHSSQDIARLNDQVIQKSGFISLLQSQIAKQVVGQEYMISRLLVGLLGQGHILLEGVPGLAKTLSINSLAKSVSATFSRVQFTPDLLPADLTGTLIFNMKENDFTVKKGPIFVHFLLADEINRAPAKVQSALLEAMQENQVTLGDKTYLLPNPFLVMATQNPIDQEGTYSLPEAQSDRFMLKCIIDYPTYEDEINIMRGHLNNRFEKINPVLNVEQLLEARSAVKTLYVDEKIEKYILDIVHATRYPEKYRLSELKPLIAYGVSPRGSINLALAARAHAFIKGRGFVVPEDVRVLVFDVLRHRIGLTYEAEAESIKVEDIIERILQSIAVP